VGLLPPGWGGVHPVRSEWRHCMTSVFSLPGVRRPVFYQAVENGRACPHPTLHDSFFRP
jgi:hypothetical protein